MEYSQRCVDFVSQFEKCRLTSYPDDHIPPVWTIGWGCTGSDVCEGMTITQEEADARRHLKLQEAADAINRRVRATLTQNQFDALTSFVYNLGEDQFKHSTMLKYLNMRKFEEAANEFPKWNHSSGRVLNGLTKRRLAEKAMFEGK